jgi:hypothetical protein
MILRAVFWIAVVAVLMPREPDLGLGRPGAGVSSPSALLSRLTSMIAPAQSDCQDNAVACAAANGLPSNLPDVTYRSLAEVKAEFDEAKREREARHNG